MSGKNLVLILKRRVMWKREREREEQMNEDCRPNYG